ncbi:MAG TPA: GMC family oxidoreductase N-terminal domain-containing protein [Bradyrhizobium sp.]|nr:GMC family oxidoreductase N-terminal domain-containing protein [Bradyrhizobium sp.]
METFDYVIVGAGSAGCVLTYRLSEDPNTSVCVLEAGPRDWHPYIHLPAGFIKTFHMKSVNWAYQQEPGPYTGGRSIYAPRGKTLGGSSSINGHIYNRGQRQDFDTWAQMGNRGWSYSDVLPYFKRLEKRVGEGEDEYRGRDGNLTVTTMDWKDTLCEAFMAGAISLGIPRNTDYNGRIQEGVSYAQRTIRNGRRVSAATAFLHPARRRGNVHVKTHAHALQIMFEGKRAVGVRYMKGGRNGTPHEVRANKEVILAGGAYNSPQLLQLSGVGSPELLQSLGIEVRHALPAVGEGLQDHYAPRTVARVKNIMTINELRQGWHLWVEALKWATTRRGLLSLSPTMVYCFWHSGETTESSDLQLTFTPASYKEGVQGQLEDEPGMTVASWQQRPESRGYVRIRSSDPFQQPIIQTNYLAAELDRRVIVAGMKLARRLLKSAPLAPYYAYEDFPGPNVQSDDEFLGAAIQRGTTTFHPGCTCRMGPADSTWAVVDDQLRVHGLEGLRVIDASVMPRMISANLNASTMMIADKASDLIRGRSAALN